MEYYPRMIDSLIERYLNAIGAILIEGPKWCGKTTTGAHHAQSVLKMQDPEMRDAYLATAQIHPSRLLRGDTPRLIDEWQMAPTLWDAVRTEVDSRDGHGLFILTGSNTIDESLVMHSGIGRIARVKMLPMSLYETKESNGSISLRELFDHPDEDIDGEPSAMNIDDLIFAACRGGWPSILTVNNKDDQLLIAQNYIDSICQSDISTVDGIGRNSGLARLILQEYARNISTLATKATMRKNITAHVKNLSPNTYDSYLNALTRLFVIEDIESWSPAIRSSSNIKRGSKHEFVDPSLAVAALGLSPDRLSLDLKTFGFIFECLCIRDLRAYSLPLGGRISYYHDRYDLEADAVLHLRDGRYALIEFKLGSSEIDMGAGHLLKIKQLIKDYNEREKQIKLREPDLLMVITGGKLAYTRPDGVQVIPIGCLRD